MAVSLSSVKSGVSSAPPIIIIYGDGGIGKSSFAANAPNPVFIFTENSLGKLDVPRFTFDEPGNPIQREVAANYEEVMESLSSLLFDEHDYKTVVIDTLDWMEPLVWNYLIRQQPTSQSGVIIRNIDDYGYGRGYKLAIDCWNDFLAMLGALRSQRNMLVMLVAHETKEKITPPDGVGYDAYTLKLQNSEKVSAKDKVVEYSDIVLFANWKVATTEEKTGSGKDQKRNRGVGSGERIVYTEKRPAYEAKNRYKLPERIHVKDEHWGDVWNALADNIPWFKTIMEEPNQPQTEKQGA